MSNLLILGGTGRTGIHVLRQAAERGHRVRALVRNPDTVQAPAGVELIQGTPASIDDLRKAARGTEAVISALNNSRASDSPWAKPVSPPMFMTDATRNTLTVMEEEGIRRIVVTSAMGAGDDWARINPAIKALMKALIKVSNLKASYDDHDGVDQILRTSDVDWTLARAVALTDKPMSGPTRAAEAGSEKLGAQINRGDLARFLLDTLEKDTWIRKTPLVWNARG
ncbi:NAD(P)-dependent oxidoreductase [Streptomyces sp. YU58]|uniref:NAD(P)-dependent oxidoreductase n=1 Tax=Streptomyces sp. SX92 TaxID=3158972 RepID=UPI0027BAAF9D|nr:NAD(P)H-binding protein [Streptomyces coralus]WLW50278.1 NAD(P)H-binding protein [Streptomyces coralus]